MAGPAPAFATFVQEEYAALRRRWPRVTHQRIMQELGRKWQRKKVKQPLQVSSLVKQNAMNAARPRRRALENS